MITVNGFYVTAQKKSSLQLNYVITKSKQWHQKHRNYTKPATPDQEFALTTTRGPHFQNKDGDARDKISSAVITD